MKFTFSDCGGCRSCELACSYHLTGEFDIAKSAIEIIEEAGGGYTVTLHDRMNGTRSACDGCQGVDDPMCARYCHSSKTLMEYIVQKREQQSKKGDEEA